MSDLERNMEQNIYTNNQRRLLRYNDSEIEDREDIKKHKEVCYNDGV